MEKALLEVWSNDRQIKDIGDYAYTVFRHHHAEIRMPLQLQRMNRAQDNFRSLLERTRDLGQAYADNSMNLANEIATTEKIEDYNIWLSYFYFMAALSKVMDVVAQFSKNPLAKAITSAKSSITDAALEIDAARKEFDEKNNPGQHMAATSVHAANVALIIANAFPETPGLPNAKWWEDVQKSLAAVIDTFKDLKALADSKKDLNKLAGDVRLLGLKATEKFTKLLDQINKAITLYDKVPKVAPERVKNLAPAALKKLPAIPKDVLDRIQKWLSVTKYSLEAIVNFLQCCLTLGEVFENRKSSQSALQRIQEQTASSGVSVKLGPDAFADATRQDMLGLLYHVNSAIDARDLGRAAIAGLKQTAEEIKGLAHSLERHRMFGAKAQTTVDEKTKALKETAGRLRTYRQSLAGNLSDKTVYGSGPGRSINWSGTKQDVVSKIDDALWKIDVFTAPYVPRYLPSRSALGPRISPL